jgi:excisionase family DNA binding protein
MNSPPEESFRKYINITTNPVAAAILVLAETLNKPETIQPIVPSVPSDPDSLSVREAAIRLHLTSRQIYQLVLSGRMKCFRDPSIRIPRDEINRYERDSVI